MSGLAEAPQIISVKTLISYQKLRLPGYQRPYKWSIKNTNQLIDDIAYHTDQEKSAYRLGTLVLHKKDGTYNIVDGQQRTVTIALIAEAIGQVKGGAPKVRPLETLKFTEHISEANIVRNFDEIKRRVRDWSPETVHFFYHKCQLVQLVLSDISEAFQFFDSQNARGKDLEPHDLLKAFHLRKIGDSITETEKVKLVATWELKETKELSVLFGHYLFRIRQWANGYSARKFTKDHVDVFKGISAYEKKPFPLAKPQQYIHSHVNHHYATTATETGTEHELPYPFQMDQVIINGSRFFDMVSHYIQLFESISHNKNERLAKECSSVISPQILATINDYPGKKRTGDGYVRNLFDCALYYYIDKFGYFQIDRALEKIFIWAYSVRLNLQSVYLASVDNKAMERPHVFKRLKEATQPDALLNIQLQPLEKVHASKVGPIEKLFQELNFIQA